MHLVAIARIPKVDLKERYPTQVSRLRYRRSGSRNPCGCATESSYDLPHVTLAPNIKILIRPFMYFGHGKSEQIVSRSDYSSCLIATSLRETTDE